ncbi:hypothetical protein KIN20_005016 [Parelaphostrongylus tenuis]|uniref:Enhancer of polycomb-like protein n=1 Tax=Parelaphostrongylus tenuis TaxID=148309 RepID=A0AAD5M3X3_PARTN|nr:hypothetical protein KIN20_005016 [Parelaphostrongylus tenuis]
MATTSKLSFRARTLDANKAMCVFYAAELPDLSECTPIARAVAQMPTGMEKEEEMESHLQDAILAQQASTSGVRVDNHVIPTPKVFPVDPARYDEVYPVHPPPPKGSLIKVQAWLALDKEEAEYDVDSEDESWLAGRPHIDPRALERIFDTLEAKSSDNNICLPDTARSALLAFDETIVDDVYDYWLSKREKSTTVRSLQLGVGGLIPRVRTECRKDQQGGLNPYVAFRRRAEKMQTRKNRKNDEESYEKVLRLGHDLRKSVTLFDMVKRREKTKIALIDLDSEILAHRMGLLDFGSNIYNQFLAKIRESAKLTSGVANGVAKSEDDTLSKKKTKRRKIRMTTSVDREVPSKAWLRKNAEVWNRPPSVFTPSSISPVAEVDQSAQAACDANLDGKFIFKRRRGCLYRSTLRANNEISEKEANAKVPIPRRLYDTFLPKYSGVIRRVGLSSRRCGRGGRVLFDRFQCWDTPRVPTSSDPFLNGLLRDDSVSFRAHLRPWQEIYNDSPKRFPSWNRTMEEEYEKRWLDSADISCSAKSPTQLGSVDNPVPVENISSRPVSTQSGNGLAGRVDSSTHILTKEYETVQMSDDWREASGSPSESNSSSDWVTPSIATQIYPVLSVEEEAQTGDHPIAKQPPINIKGCVITHKISLLEQGLNNMLWCNAV